MKSDSELKRAREAGNLIPWFKFPQDWDVKVIPSGFADARFIVKNGDNVISVYFDLFNKLGYFGNSEPYWEVYPIRYADYEDVARFDASDIKGLFACIQSQLDGKIYTYGDDYED